MHKTQRESYLNWFHPLGCINIINTEQREIVLLSTSTFCIYWPGVEELSSFYYNNLHIFSRLECNQDMPF